MFLDTYQSDYCIIYYMPYIANCNHFWISGVAVQAKIFVNLGISCFIERALYEIS